MSLQGRVALVTGSGRGVGRAIALGLAEDGADVAVNYRRDQEAAAKVVAAIKRLGRRAAAYQASVDDGQQDAQMVAAVEAELGPVGILVNNAGIASRGHSVRTRTRRRCCASSPPMPSARTICRGWSSPKCASRPAATSS